MALKSVLKRVYFLLPILSVLYFLTIKKVIQATNYVIFAVLLNFYFFPIKLFLGSGQLASTSRKRIVVLLSYFVISNIIAL